MANKKRMTKQQKVDLAKEICEKAGCSLTILLMKGNVNSSRVEKRCKAHPDHPPMEVSLGSIVALGRGGCARCAQIKGGKNSKRGKASKSKQQSVH